MTIQTIFNDLSRCRDFKENIRSLGISRADYVRHLIEQAQEDRHFRLVSCAQHRIRFGHAKRSRRRKKDAQSVGRQRNAGHNPRDCAGRNRRKHVGTSGGMA